MADWVQTRLHFVDWGFDEKVGVHGSGGRDRLQVAELEGAFFDEEES